MHKKQPREGDSEREGGEGGTETERDASLMNGRRKGNRALKLMSKLIKERSTQSTSPLPSLSQSSKKQRRRRVAANYGGRESDREIIV